MIPKGPCHIYIYIYKYDITKFLLRSMSLCQCPNLDLKVEQLLWKLIQLRHASQTNLAKSCHSSDMGVEPKIGVVGDPPNHPLKNRGKPWNKPSILGGGSPYFWFNTHMFSTFVEIWQEVERHVSRQSHHFMIHFWLFSETESTNLISSHTTSKPGSCDREDLASFIFTCFVSVSFRNWTSWHHQNIRFLHYRQPSSPSQNPTKIRRIQGKGNGGSSTSSKEVEANGIWGRFHPGRQWDHEGHDP